MEDNIIDNVIPTEHQKVKPDNEGSGSQIPNGNVESNLNIDDIFGDPNDDNPNGTPSQQSVSKDPFASNNNSHGKSTEELLKQFQSGYDKATHENEELQKTVNEYKGAYDFVNALYQDKEIFKAFVAEIDSELVKPQTPEEYIKNNLAKEFGEDFVPDDAEQSIIGSKTWLYNKRGSDLYNEAINMSNKLPDSLETIRNKRAKANEAANLKAQQEKQAIMSQFNWQENDYNNFAQWAQKVTPMEFAKIYNFGKNKMKNKPQAPSLASVPGGTPHTDNTYFKHLDEMFGAN